MQKPDFMKLATSWSVRYCVVGWSCLLLWNTTGCGGVDQPLTSSPSPTQTGTPAPVATATPETAPPGTDTPGTDTPGTVTPVVTPTAPPTPTVEPPTPTLMPTPTATPVPTPTAPPDVDGDGFSPNEGDCDDLNGNTYPGAVELGDGKDNDCDSQIDEGLNTTDDDKDTYSEETGDCDDADPSRNPGAEEVPYDGIDQDCSGLDLTDVDEDGSASVLVGGDDCNDEVPEINPSALEVPYNGIDEDCSGTDLVDVDDDGVASTGAGGTDCNDLDPDISPKAAETCDGIDNNCDGVVDTDAIDRLTWYDDLDTDGYGDPESATQSCVRGEGQLSDGTDCDDGDASAYPGAMEVCDGADNDCQGDIDEGVTTVYYGDADKDGYGSSKVTIQACSLPAGYSVNSTDCDDTRADVNPGYAEVCDGVDNNCNTQTDEGVKSTFYQDADSDGYGNSAVTVQACTAPTGYVSDKTDCNDRNADISPGEAEYCNNKDDNCNGKIDDGVTVITYYQDQDKDGYGNSSVTLSTCAGAPTGYVSNGGDCSDSNAAINPGAIETCNTIDDNCNGTIDEGAKSTWYRDADGDSFGTVSNTVQACTQPTGYVASATDCNDANANINPNASETCNYLDDNCNGQTDEGVAITWYKDGDGDGYGNPAISVANCIQPAGYVSNKNDCNDVNAAVNPGSAEQANGIDDNCNGQTDEGVGVSCYTIKQGNSSATSGYYNIDPDGAGTRAAFKVYCDMTTDGGGWTRVYYQSTLDGVFFGVGQFEVNKSDPSNIRYAILNDLEYFRRNSGFEFKMDWPGTAWTDYMQWQQSSNPVTDIAGANPTGYSPIHVPYKDYNGWGGLQRSLYPQYSLLDGTLNPQGNWYFAVGTTYAWNAVPNAQPGPTGGVTYAELWVR